MIYFKVVFTKIIIVQVEEYQHYLNKENNILKLRVN